jgi:hypothetical protein
MASDANRLNPVVARYLARDWCDEGDRGECSFVDVPGPASSLFATVKTVVVRWIRLDRHLLPASIAGISCLCSLFDRCACCRGRVLSEAKQSRLVGPETRDRQFHVCITRVLYEHLSNN